MDRNWNFLVTGYYEILDSYRESGGEHMERITGFAGNIQPFNDFKSDLSFDDEFKEPIDSICIGDKNDQKNISSRRKISVIISSKDPEKLEKLKQETISNPNNRIKSDLPIVNAFSADIDINSLNNIKAIMRSNQNISIYPDQKLRITDPFVTGSSDNSRDAEPTAKITGVDKIWDKGFTGKGMTICIIDSGIAKHNDFKDRIIAFKDFVSNKDGVENAYDDVGHGTFCASVAAGSGSESGGIHKGAAPDANIVAIKVINKFSTGDSSDGIKAIQWAIENKEKYHIDVISMSLGDKVIKPYKDDPLAMAAEKAIEAGIIFCAAAGNLGHKRESIGNPGYAEHVITVGSVDDKKTIDFSDDELPKFSGKGPTKFDGLAKPDIIASGVDITGASNKGGYTTKSGTSMSCPLVAGVTLLLKQSAPDATPGKIKESIMNTARDLNGLPKNHQGSGVINPEAAFNRVTKKNQASQSIY